MLDQFKKIAELKKLQDTFKKEEITVENNGVSVLMNGNFEVLEIKLNPQLDIPSQQEAVKKSVNQAREDIQKKLAKIAMGAGFGF